MSCVAFPHAGFGVKRERYEELIDVIKVVKEQLEKERREKRQERRHIDEISKFKKADYKKKSEEEIKYTSGNWEKKKRRHLELEPKYDDYYYTSSSERRKRRRDDYEHEHEHVDETQPFERRCTSLMSWEKKLVPALPAPVSVPTTSAYDIDSASNDNKTKTNKEEDLSSTSSETSSSSSSSCGINISGINDEEEITTNKRSSWSLEKEELEYKKLELQKMVPFNYAALPPPDLDWLYPKTTAKKDEDVRKLFRGEAEERRRRRIASDDDENSSLSSLGPPRAQYLHEVHIFALPYVLPF